MIGAFVALKSCFRTLFQASEQNRSLTMTENDGGDYTVVTILHFNDCYNIESQKSEPVGGAARFKTVLKSFEFLDPLVLFSGDIISPSSSECRWFNGKLFVESPSPEAVLIVPSMPLR